MSIRRWKVAVAYNGLQIGGRFNDANVLLALVALWDEPINKN